MVFAFFGMFFFASSYLLPNHYLPWLAAYQEFLAFFGGAAVFLAVAPLRLRFSRLALVFLAFSALPFVQYCFGVVYFFGDAFVAGLYLLALSIAVGYGYSLSALQLQKVVFFSFLVFVISGVISVWLQLIQWLSLPANLWVVEMPPGGRPFANMAQPNNLATLLSLALLGVLYFFEQEILSTKVCALVAFILIFGLVLTQSRTPWVAGVVFFSFWLVKRQSVSLRLGVRWLGAWLMFYFFLVFALPICLS